MALDAQISHDANSSFTRQGHGCRGTRHAPWDRLRLQGHLATEGNGHTCEARYICYIRYAYKARDTSGGEARDACSAACGRKTSDACGCKGYDGCGGEPAGERGQPAACGRPNALAELP